MACAGPGDTLLVARNCHLSVVSGMVLSGEPSRIRAKQLQLQLQVQQRQQRPQAFPGRCKRLVQTACQTLAHRTTNALFFHGHAQAARRAGSPRTLTVTLA